MRVPPSTSAGHRPTDLGNSVPSNKELKLTKPSIMELRSLTPVLCGLLRER
jgi:hypothetical protein